MRSELVEQAATVIPEVPVLVNMVSRRVRQLNQGRPSLIPPRPSLGMADIALLEIIDGKIVLDEATGEPVEPETKG